MILVIILRFIVHRRLDTVINGRLQASWIRGMMEKRKNKRNITPESSTEVT